MLDSATIGLDRRLQDLVEKELEPSERVRWASKPIPRWFINGSLFAMVFGLIWTGMLVGMLRAAIRHELNSNDGTRTLSWMEYGFALIFLAVGFIPLLSPVFHHQQMRRSVYIITDRRALIIRRGWFGTRIVQSFAPARLVQLERTERRNGTGDLVFEVVKTGSGSGSHTERRGFVSVANVREVEHILRETLLVGRTRALASEMSI